MENKKVKVGYFPMQAFFLAFGGFEVQMLTAANLFQSDDEIDIVKINPWESNYNFDIIHFWGCSDHHYVNFKWAKSTNSKVIITTLLPYFSFSNYLKMKVRSFLLLDKKIKFQYINADKIIVLNSSQARALSLYYSIPKHKIAIIPNTILSDYLKYNTLNKQEDIGEKYVLCIGNISKRKNQLILAKEMTKINKKCIFVGGLLKNENDYYMEFRKVVTANKLHNHINHLQPGSEDLANLYLNCEALILLSEDETQPITILEALYFNCKVILPKRNWSKQFCDYKNVIYVDFDRLEMISWDVILDTPISFSNDLFKFSYHPDKVKNNFKDTYLSINK